MQKSQATRQRGLRTDCECIRFIDITVDLSQAPESFKRLTLARIEPCIALADSAVAAHIRRLHSSVANELRGALLVCHLFAPLIYGLSWEEYHPNRLPIVCVLLMLPRSVMGEYYISNSAFRPPCAHVAVTTDESFACRCYELRRRLSAWDWTRMGVRVMTLT